MSIIAIGLIWAGCLLLSWAIYAIRIDRVIKHIHDNHYDVWVSYGRPKGHLYRPPGGTFFALQKIDKKLRTDGTNAEWVKNDPQAEQLLSQYLTFDRFYRKSLPYVLAVAIASLFLSS